MPKYLIFRKLNFFRQMFRQNCSLGCRNIVYGIYFFSEISWITHLALINHSMLN